MRKNSTISLFVLLFALLLLPISIFASDLGGNASPLIHNNIKYAYWAFFLGGLSAISLPLGSILGLAWQPSPKITAIFTAFGGGALLAALSIELVAPTVELVVRHAKEGEVQENHSPKMIALIVGCIVGGIFFYVLNELLNSKGGYLRKVSTTITHFNMLKINRYKMILKNLSRYEIFRTIPKNHIQELIRHLEIVDFKKGDIIFRAGEIAGGMYIIEKGEIELQLEGKTVKELKAGEMVGEISMLKHVSSKVTAIAKTDLHTFELLNDDFDKIRNKVPELETLALQFAEKELDHYSHFLVDKQESVASEDWSDHAEDQLHHSGDMPTQQEIHDVAKSNNSAPLAIWLGIFLDGIPESFVIGAGFLMILMSKMSLGDPSLGQVIPYTLIAGLFLSNLPEAMSSSIGMRKMGWKKFKILSMWLSLTLMTAVGAVVGFYFGTSISETTLIAVEGMAAGAMLTMIAQTMIPEAVHIGGAKVVGLGTLAGYLSAVGFKVFE